MIPRFAATTGAAVLAAALFASAAAAHDTVLLPSTYAARQGESVPIDVTSITAFPKPETGPKAARIDRFRADIDRAPQPISLGAERPEALGLLLTPDRAGRAVVAVTFRPRDIDLEASEVAHYFDEIAAPAWIRQAWAAQPEPRVMRETYVKNAKTHVCVDRCHEGGAIYPVGQSLEFVLVPRRDENGRERRDLGFRLVERGRAVPGHAIAWTAPTGERRMLTTDAQGRVFLPANTPGPLLLSAVVIRPPAAAGARYTSDWATLTLHPDALRERRDREGLQRR